MGLGKGTGGHILLSTQLINKNEILENPGIDPGTSHMLSERSTT